MVANYTTAVITGGTSGIGRATAKKLANLGIHVIVAARSIERGEETVAEIRSVGGRADFVSTNLHDEMSARLLAKTALELGEGHVDILINNAATFPPFGMTHDITESTFEGTFGVNVKVPYFLVAELAPLMAKRGSGTIINITTMVTEYGQPGLSLYSASKAAIKMLTKCWAAEYGPSGVRVNAVSPGPTLTEGVLSISGGDSFTNQMASQAPAGRPATPDEIAEAIVFLATDVSSYINGAILPVDGGRTAV
ncbi:SDR family NAD(P)-dependent oxidoreductase [Alicyclobacillus dauci]|uniref:SDR family oxidoreductase n=1 Tax=Alicyclobacillus dauci TaxID=1475485 RepID=A0ABY6YZJ9_9BACL|nr:SDR family oxidoreductase [Alicyclobacillus dauci]WAH36049.1 SDR family oxidoreductase [Alicyclobacillus dauci]